MSPTCRLVPTELVRTLSPARHTWAQQRLAARRCYLSLAEAPREAPREAWPFADGPGVLDSCLLPGFLVFSIRPGDSHCSSQMVADATHVCSWQRRLIVRGPPCTCGGTARWHAHRRLLALLTIPRSLQQQGNVSSSLLHLLLHKQQKQPPSLPVRVAFRMTTFRTTCSWADDARREHPVCKCPWGLHSCGVAPHT